MIEQYDNILNCKEHLREKLPILIEAFVSFYGEERRQEIEEKFSKAIFIAYRTPESTQSYLHKISSLLTDEIVQKAIDEESSSYTLEELLNKTSFEYASIVPIHHYSTFLELYELGEEGRIERFKEKALNELHQYLPELTKEEYEKMIQTQSLLSKYEMIRPIVKNNLLYYLDLSHADTMMEREFNQSKALIQSIDPSITLETFSYFYDNERLKDLNRIAHKYPELVEEYIQRMSKYDSYQKEIEEERERKHNLTIKYYVEWVEENKELLNEEDLISFQKYKENPSSSYLLSNRLRTIFGLSLQSNHPFDAFSEEANEIVAGNGANWKRDSIIKQRVQYFRDCGVELGEEYEAYLNSEEAKKIWPTTEQVEKFMQTRNHKLNEFNIDYYTNHPDHKEIRREIEERGLLDKEDPMNASLYTRQNSTTMVSPNVVRTKNGYDICSIIAINCSNVDGTIDHNIVHELGHQFELFLKEADDKTYTMICGWESLTGTLGQQEVAPIDTLSRDDSKRNYELFNEIINEVISQEICQKLQEKGQTIFDNPSEVRYKHVTSYEQTFYIVKDFYNEYKKEIIESRSSGNIEVIWNKVGKENFDALNELFHIHYEHFSGFQYYSLMESLQKGEDNKLTRVYKDIIERRNKILDQMRKYSMTHENEEEKQEGEHVKS